MTIRWLIIVGIGLIALTACGGNTAEKAVSVPTRTLIPPSATPTLHPADTTPAPTDLPSASEFKTVPTPAAYNFLFPVAAQAMIDLTMADLVDRAGVNPKDIRLLSLDAFTWQDSTFGCLARDDVGSTDSRVTPGYRLVYGMGQRVYVYHTDRRAGFFVCDDPAWLALEGDPIPLDPIEASMVEFSARDAGRTLGVAEEDVQLVSLITVDWPDSSVGCPRPNADYADEVTPGYRMVFRAGADTLIYHTSIRQAVRCAPQEEILPGVLREALATPEAGDTG
jgi:hypothetical protein